MQLQRFNSILLISLTIIAIFGCASSLITSLLLTSDLILFADIIDHGEFLLTLADPTTKLNGMQFINILVLISLSLIPLLFILIRNSQLYILENKRVVFQDVKKVLKQHPHIIWTEFFNTA